MNKTKTQPPRGKRFFTLDEANRMLPLVRAIVKDMMHLAQQASALQEQLAAEPTSSKKKTPERQQHYEELENLAEQWENHRQELRDLGVEFKGAGMEGLVDFPAWVEGREVELCWKHDEPAIEHWHELYAGFSGRQPISNLPAQAIPEDHRIAVKQSS